MGLLSKIKSIFGFGGAKQSSTPNAKQKGQHSQKFEKKPGEKRSKRNNKQRSEGRRPEGQQHPGHRERRENLNQPVDARRGPTRSRSAKPHRARTSNESTAMEPSQQAPVREVGRHDRKSREGGKSRGPRIDPNLRNTPAHRERPGGAFTPEQLKAYAAAHAAWDPASYVVPEAEGKKRFVDFGLPGEILHAVADLEFQYCTPIQAQSLEFSLEGKNVAGRAQTGTGKTAAFLIAVLTRYLRTPERRNLKPGTPRALILAPTRELVIQICKDAEALGKYCGDVRSLAVYGGMDYERQRRELEDAPVDILVATPGRLIDFVRNHIINLRLVDTLVIDEADRMLDMGFIPDVRAIVNRLPDRDRRCTMLYSATLNDTVMNLAAMWMRDPIRVEVESETMTTETIRQVVYIARSEEKFKLLYNHLVKYSDARTIIFCNRKFTTERICENLRRRGIPCEMLSGDVNQVRRLKILEAFRAGDVRTVVATDVAGRGIHVDDIAFVVNYDFPYEPEDYVHRIGRTGRAGHTGTAISFADEDESFIIPDIEAYIKEPLKCVMPEEWMYAEIPAPAPRHKRGERKGAPKAVATEAPVAEAPVEAPVDVAPTADVSPEVDAFPIVVEGPLPQVAPVDLPEVEGELPIEAPVPNPLLEPIEDLSLAIEVKGPLPQVAPDVQPLPVIEDAVETPEVEMPIVKAPVKEITVVKASVKEITVVKKAAPTMDAFASPAVVEASTVENPVVVTEQEEKPIQQPHIHRRHHVARPSNHVRKGGAVVARPQGSKQEKRPSPSMAAPNDVRPEREPRFKPHLPSRPKPTQGPHRGEGSKEKNERPHRTAKPVAKRWSRHRSAAMRGDATEGRYTATTTPRMPIYAPGTRGPVTDEWTPGQ